MSDSDLLRALDPRHSAVVEACAGSGKTWLLVSRVVRALLEGCAPGEILAITYTRKAAREIEQRLHESLRFLALADDAAARGFLYERGVQEPDASRLLSSTNALYEKVLASPMPMRISTFHGWFASLLQGAPLTSGLAGMELVESKASVLEEAWQLFAQGCARRPESLETQSMLWLFEQIGAENTRQLLFRFIARRAEWHAYTEDAPAPLGHALEALRADLGVGEQPGAVEAFFADPDVIAGMREYAQLLARNTPTDRTHAEWIDGALSSEDRDVALDTVRKVFFTLDGALRKRGSSARQARALGADGAARLLELHLQLGERIARAYALRREERVYIFNCHALRVAVVLLEQLERYKRERRIVDFEDLERHADTMLRDEATAAYVQARLDARYRQILVDEFQDTNPLQWRVLLGWLGAYAEDMPTPKVFIVGDPKQSIYRFRRAEPRIFRAAQSLLTERFGAQRFATITTRRNAPKLVNVINCIFRAEPLFDPFAEHRSYKQTVPGRIELMPLCERGKSIAADTSGKEHLRDPLREARCVIEDRRRRDEALAVVARLGEIVGSWPIADERGPRPAVYDDVFILARRRGALLEIERALRGAGMPYLSVSRGGLLQTLEALDLQALLRFLSTPSDNLALAHSLRSPLFGAGDDDLLALASGEGPDWWHRLGRLASRNTVTEALSRAHRLLNGWLALAARLPAHDLIDHIYHQADALARFRSSVPAAAWPGVRANLEAFVALALQLDSGRFPSLPRFVDELARLMQADDQEAPDEGLLGFERGGGGRVRLMTIHAAKGLEAPIVWLADANSTHRMPDTYHVLLDWPEQAQRPRQFLLATRKDERSERLRTLFETEEMLADREELNLLYVALTRAKQYFLASGIVTSKPSGRKSAYERIALALETLGGSDRAYGDEPMPLAAGGADGCDAKPLPQVASEAAPAVEPIGVRRAAPTPEAEYGTCLHALLERLSTSDTPPGCPPAGVSALEWARLQAAAWRILSASHLQCFFQPGAFRRAMNEVEFVLPDGTVGRIDRLVETDECVWVLDYKSGNAETERLDDYRAQLEGYRSAVSALFPQKAVRCGLVFGDAQFMEV